MDCHYKLLPTTDLRKDEESILQALIAVKDNELENDIKLLNYYREVPINFGVSIDEVDHGLVEMTVHQLQAALMKLQKETLIRSSHLRNDVIAKVNRAGTENGVAFLSHFSYVQVLSDRRSHIRVSVAENIDVQFRSKQFRLQGRLSDISIGGMAVSGGEKPGIEANVKGEVSFTLRGVPLVFPAHLLRIDDEPPQKRYIFQYAPDSKIESHISHYVFQTQSEIIRELKDKFI
jgi:hypothetical protein